MARRAGVGARRHRCRYRAGQVGVTHCGSPGDHACDHEGPEWSPAGPSNSSSIPRRSNRFRSSRRCRTPPALGTNAALGLALSVSLPASADISVRAYDEATALEDLLIPLGQGHTRLVRRAQPNAGGVWHQAAFAVRMHAASQSRVRAELLIRRNRVRGANAPSTNRRNHRIVSGKRWRRSGHQRVMFHEPSRLRI
jgi:hypothetical protein